MAKPLVYVLEKGAFGSDNEAMCAYSPGRIDESANVGVEGTVNGVQDSHLREGLGGKHQHESDNHVADNLLFLSSVLKLPVRCPGLLTKAAGPPLRRAPPEPTKRPAPMAPPEVQSQ